MTLLEALRAQTERGERGETARQRIAAAWAADPTHLLGLLTHEAHTVRTLTADALGRVGDRRAVGPLVAQLAGADAAEVGHIAEALAAIGARHPASLTESLPALTPYLTADDMWLRVAVGEALAHLAGQQPRAAEAAVPGMLAGLLLAERQAAYDLTMNALIGMGSPAIPPLVAQLEADDTHIQQQAAYILEQLARAHPAHAEHISAALAAWRG